MTANTDITKTTASFVNKMLFESKITIISANRLFRKWANIATKILLVLRYRIETQIANINAENMLPKV